MNKIIPLSITAFFALIGGILFELAHIPMPWLLGPLFITMFVRFTTKLPIKWHNQLRNLGLVLAGYSIGIAFTVDAFSNMGQYFPLMIMMNIFYILLFILLSKFIVKRTNVDNLAALTSTVPGGMTQILSYAAEKSSKHLTMITFYQVLRVLCLLSFVPLIVSAAKSTTEHASSIEHSYTLLLLPFLVIAFLSGIVANKIKIPTGYLLGPVILLIIVQLFGVIPPAMPSSALQFAQLLIGVFIGMLLRKEDLRLPKKIIFYGFISAAVYIGSAYLLSFIIIHYYPLDFKTAFLSIIPGGLDQMGLIATSVNADVTIVTAFQLFRVLVVSIILVPALKHFTKSL